MQLAITSLHRVIVVNSLPSVVARSPHHHHQHYSPSLLLFLSFCARLHQYATSSSSSKERELGLDHADRLFARCQQNAIRSMQLLKLAKKPPLLSLYVCVSKNCKLFRRPRTNNTNNTNNNYDNQRAHYSATLPLDDFCTALTCCGNTGATSSIVVCVGERTEEEKK